MEGKQEHQFYDPLEKPVDHSVNDASLPMALSQNQSSLHPSPRSLDILPTKIPEHLRILLDTWHEKHGDSVPPPCATTSRLHADPNKKRNRQPSVFIHTSKDCEGIMIAKRYPTLVKDKTVLVCKCMQCKHPATIIMFWQRSQGEYPQGYYEWLGEESWEEYPSVKKIDAEPPKRRAQKRRVSSTTSSDDSDFRTHHCPDPTKAILPADLSVKNVIENRRRSGEPRINFWQYFLPKPKEKENRASDLRRKQPRLSTEGQIDTLDADHELEELSLHNTTNHALKQRKGSLAIKDLAIDPRAAPMVPASLSPFGIPLVAAAGRSGSASVSSTPSNTMPLLRARPLELPSRDSRPQVAEALLPKTLESSLNDASSIKHKINSPTAVDLTLEDAPPVQAGSLSLSSDSPILRQRPPMDDDILTRHIQNHTILNFVPLPPLPLRTRPFSKCNTLQKLYGQAQQSGLFAQEMPLGRFLEINIMGVKTMGIPEEDEEDFDEFVRELKMAPCWKKKDEEGIDWKGDCTVEVRLKT